MTSRAKRIFELASAVAVLMSAIFQTGFIWSASHYPHVVPNGPVDRALTSVFSLTVLWVGGTWMLLDFFRKFKRPSSTPPTEARFLILLFMRGAAGDALLGDLEERFHRIARDPELGPGRARFWYWFQVVISLRPLAWAFVKRVTGLAVAYEAILNALK